MNVKLTKFLLVGNGSYDNRGCEAIVRGTTEVLSRRFPEIKLTIISVGGNAGQDAQTERDPRIEHRPPGERMHKYSPSWWLYRIILRQFPNLSYKYIHRCELSALKDADCALEAGGDNYSLDYGSPLWLTAMDKVILDTGKPLILWGASVGPFTKDPGVEAVMSKHLRKLSLILARESDTVEYLDSIGVRDNVRHVADPAFLMQPSEPALPTEIADFLLQRPIGLNFSPLAGRFFAHNKSDWETVVHNCIHTLGKEGIGPILLIPHVTHKESDDYSFMVQAAAKVPGWGETVKILSPTLTAPEYKWVISKLRAFAGARTHATIAAYSSEIPTICLGYSMKAKGICRDIFGNHDWLLPVVNLSPEIFKERFEHLLAREDKIREELRQSIPIMKDRALSAADYVAEILDK